VQHLPASLAECIATHNLSVRPGRAESSRSQACINHRLTIDPAACVAWQGHCCQETYLQGSTTSALTKDVQSAAHSPGHHLQQECGM
jgi:hypothetical protein